jgi:predicted nucleotidyltransferase
VTGGQPIDIKSAEDGLARAGIKIPQAEIAAFCRRYHIRKLALFGSVLRNDFGADSDIDVLVEFEPNHVPGLIRLAGMELELSELLGGHKVDMNILRCLSPYSRNKVLAEAEVLYAEA